MLTGRSLLKKLSPESWLPLFAVPQCHPVHLHLVPREPPLRTQPASPPFPGTVGSHIRWLHVGVEKELVILFCAFGGLLRALLVALVSCSRPVIGYPPDLVVVVVVVVDVLSSRDDAIALPLAHPPPCDDGPPFRQAMILSPCSSERPHWSSHTIHVASAMQACHDPLSLWHYIPLSIQDDLLAANARTRCCCPPRPPGSEYTLVIHRSTHCPRR